MSKCPTCEQTLHSDDLPMQVETRVNLLVQIRIQHEAVVRAEAVWRKSAQVLAALHASMDKWEIGLLQAAEKEKADDS